MPARARKPRPARRPRHYAARAWPDTRLAFVALLRALRPGAANRAGTALSRVLALVGSFADRLAPAPKATDGLLAMTPTLFDNSPELLPIVRWHAARAREGARRRQAGVRSAVRGLRRARHRQYCQHRAASGRSRGLTQHRPVSSQLPCAFASEHPRVHLAAIEPGHKSAGRRNRLDMPRSRVQAAPPLCANH